MARETDPEADRSGPGGTPEGHTPEAAAPDELGKKGTPAAGLSPERPHIADAAEAADAPGAGASHGAAAGHAANVHDTDEHAGEALGPIDWPAWGAGAVGVLVALLIALALAVPTLPG